jgi:hypothetical protein
MKDASLQGYAQLLQGWAAGFSGPKGQLNLGIEVSCKGE